MKISRTLLLLYWFQGKLYKRQAEQDRQHTESKPRCMQDLQLVILPFWINTFKTVALYSWTLYQQTRNPLCSSFYCCGLNSRIYLTICQVSQGLPLTFKNTQFTLPHTQGHCPLCYQTRLSRYVKTCWCVLNTKCRFSLYTWFTPNIFELACVRLHTVHYSIQ